MKRKFSSGSGSLTPSGFDTRFGRPRTFGRSRSRISRHFGKEGDDSDGGGGDPDPAPDNQPLGEGGMKALRQEREEKRRLAQQAKELQQKLAAFEGVSIDEIQQLKEEAETRKQKELEEKQNYQQALVDKENKFAQERQALAQERDRYKATYENLVIESDFTEAFFEAGGKHGEGEGQGPKAYAKLLFPQLRQYLRLDEDGKTIVVDANGDPRFNKETGRDYTVADLVAEYRKGATAVLFESSVKGAGSGMNGDARRRVGGNQLADLRNLPPAERINRARAMGITT